MKQFKDYSVPVHSNVHIDSMRETVQKLLFTRDEERDEHNQNDMYDEELDASEWREDNSDDDVQEGHNTDSKTEEEKRNKEHISVLSEADLRDMRLGDLDGNDLNDIHMEPDIDAWEDRDKEGALGKETNDNVDYDNSEEDDTYVNMLDERQDQEADFVQEGLRVEDGSIDKHNAQQEDTKQDEVATNEISEDAKLFSEAETPEDMREGGIENILENTSKTENDALVYDGLVYQNKVLINPDNFAEDLVIVDKSRVGIPSVDSNYKDPDVINFTLAEQSDENVNYIANEKALAVLEDQEIEALHLVWSEDEEVKTTIDTHVYERILTSNENSKANLDISFKDIINEITDDVEIKGVNSSIAQGDEVLTEVIVNEGEDGVNENVKVGKHAHGNMDGDEEDEVIGIEIEAGSAMNKE
eukprot:CFRG3707T1